MSVETRRSNAANDWFCKVVPCASARNDLKKMRKVSLERCHLAKFVMKLNFRFFATGLALGILAFSVFAFRIKPSAQAVVGTLEISGTSQTLTGDVTAGRLVDQANASYYIDPAASSTSLVTAGSIGIGTTTITEKFNISGNIGFTGGGKIRDSSGKLELQAGGSGTGSTGTGSIYFLDSSGGVTGRFDSTAGSGTWPEGDGADGAITVSVNKNINTDTLATGRSCVDGGDAVNYSVTASVAAAATSITLSSTPSSGCLAVGDEVLIINLQGTSGDNANVGKYETKTISAISTATLTVSALTNAYDGTTQKIMVQRVPNYTSVTVNSGITLTANAWDGTKGGVLFFRANGTVTVTGTISMASKGFRGGLTGTAPENYTGRPSFAGGGGGGGGGANGTSGDNYGRGGTPSGSDGGYGPGGNGASGAGGGGSGSGNNAGVCGAYSGGLTGGGSTCNNGTAGTGGGGGSNGNQVMGGGGGAKPYNSLSNSTPTTFNTVLLGGGSAPGGGGGGGGMSYSWQTGSGKGGSADGGNSGNPGGGVIIVKANNVSVTGSVTSEGGAGGNGGGGGGGVSGCSTVFGGGGGGGFGANGAAGGSILIHAPTVNLGASTVVATGGSGGSGGAGGPAGYTGACPGQTAGDGGSGGSGSTGGAGVTRIVYTTNNGSLTHSPTPTTSTTLDSGSNYGAFYLSTTNTSSQDLAEYYVSGDKTIEAGDVVTIAQSAKLKAQNGEDIDTKGVLMKADTPYDKNLIGIISTKPGVLMGSVDGTDQSDQRMLALAGRVPVKIDPDSPAIAVGDFLTSSTKPGLAIKATRPGYVVARALEPWNSCKGVTLPEQGDTLKNCGAGRIEAFLQLTYSMGDIDPWGNFRSLEVDTLKVNKTLEVRGVNILDRLNKVEEELNDLKRQLGR